MTADNKVQSKQSDLIVLGVFLAAGGVLISLLLIGISSAVVSVFNVWVLSVDDALDPPLFATLLGLAFAAFTFMSSRAQVQKKEYWDRIEYDHLDDEIVSNHLSAAEQFIEADKRSTDQRNESAKLWAPNNDALQESIGYLLGSMNAHRSYLIAYRQSARGVRNLRRSLFALFAGMVWSLTIDMGVNFADYKEFDVKFDIPDIAEQVTLNFLGIVDILGSIIWLYVGLRYFYEIIKTPKPPKLINTEDEQTSEQ